MVEISKIMIQNRSDITKLTCKELLHPFADNCTDAFQHMLYLCAKGFVKYFAPYQALFLVSISKICFM